MTRDVKATELNIAAALQEAAGALAEAARGVSLAKASPPQNYSKPQPDWLPWHIARFCFLPRFADPKKSFASDVKLLIERIGQSRQLLEFETADPSICLVRLGQLALKIDSDTGEFSINATGDDEDAPFPITQDATGLFGLPEDFFARCGSGKRAVNAVFQSDAAALIDLSEALWSAMRSGFRHALRSGAARVFGRWQSIHSELTPIWIDQLLELDEPRITITDTWLSDFDYRSVLIDPLSDGVAAFSLHVAPQISRDRSKGMKGEDAAIAALVDEMRGAPDRPRLRADVQQEYVKRFGITPEGFKKRVWRAATQLVPGCRWGLPGRRSVSPVGRRSLSRPGDVDKGG